MKIFIIFAFFFTISFLCKAQENENEALAFQYYQQADYEKASVLLAQLFNDTKNDNYFELYFNSLIKIKKYKESETFLNKLIKQNPEKTAYKVALGRVYQETGRTVESYKIYLEVINNLPKDENNYRQLANDFYRFEAYDMATNVFLQGRKVFADPKLFGFELLSIYRYQKNKVMLTQEYVNILSTFPEMLPQAQNVLSNVFEEQTDYQILQSALLKKIQNEPQSEVFTTMLVWQFIQQQEYELALRQLLAQDKRTNANGLAIYQIANTFVNNKAFTTAIKAYDYLLTKGVENDLYIPAKIALINVKFELAVAGKYELEDIKNLATAYQEVLSTYGKVPQTLFALKKLAYLQAYYLNDLAEAEKTITAGTNINGLPATALAELKIELGDIYLLSKQPWEAILVYEQVAKQFEGQAIGSEARYRSAKLNFYVGEFKYAKSQADVLKASTSSLIANDALNLSLLIADNLLNKNDSLALTLYADADMLLFMKKNDEAILKLDSIDVRFPNNSLVDDILMAKANIYMAKNELIKSTTALNDLIKNYPSSIWIDDALFLLGDLLEKKLDKPEEAKKIYQQLISDYPGSMFNAEARKRFRQIRGDNVGT